MLTYISKHKNTSNIAKEFLRSQCLCGFVLTLGLLIKNHRIQLYWKKYKRMRWHFQTKLWMQGAFFTLIKFSLTNLCSASTTKSPSGGKLCVWVAPLRASFGAASENSSYFLSSLRWFPISLPFQSVYSLHPSSTSVAPFSSSPAAFCLPLSLRMQPYVLMHQNWLHHGITLFFSANIYFFFFLFWSRLSMTCPRQRSSRPTLIIFSHSASRRHNDVHAHTHTYSFFLHIFFFTQNGSQCVCVCVRVCFPCCLNMGGCQSSCPSLHVLPFEPQHLLLMLMLC